MTTLKKAIKYIVIAFAIFLIITIIGVTLSSVWLFGGQFRRDAVLDDIKTYSVTSEINNLNIRINAADLYIKEGNIFSIESNLKYINLEEKGDTLIVEETKKFRGNYNGSVLTIYIPSGTILYNTNITTGAGRLTIENLSSGTLDLELGAGEVYINSLIATQSADIEGGAGRITIVDSILKNLDFEMGVGQLNLTTALIGECQLNLGVGETNLILIGNKNDYKLELEKGLGRVFVDGKDAFDYASSGNGINLVEINGGIGSINVQFKESEEKWY